MPNTIHQNSNTNPCFMYVQQNVRACAHLLARFEMERKKLLVEEEGRVAFARDIPRLEGAFPSIGRTGGSGAK